MARDAPTDEDGEQEAPPNGQPPQSVLPPRPQSRAFFLLVLVGLMFLAWVIFRPFLIFMTLGVFIAVLALPVDKFFERFLPNRLSAVATMLVLLILVAGPIVSIGFALFEDAQSITRSVQQGSVEARLNDALDLVYPNQTTDERNETIDNLWLQFKPRITAALQDLVGNLVGFVADFIIALVIVLFVVYYVLVDGEGLVAYLRRALPMPVKQVDFLLQEARQGLNAVFIGQILTSLIQGALGGVGFLIAGLPGVVLWASLMAILSLLPVVGAFLIWMPAAVYLFIVGDLWQAIFLVVWGVVVVGQIDNFVRPKLIGDRAHIHPIFVLIGVLGGVAAFGFTGLFLGPLLVGVLISVLKVWEQDYLDPELKERKAAQGAK